MVNGGEWKCIVISSLRLMFATRTRGTFATRLRRSMRQLIEKGSAFEAHPSQWAPFVVVGGGGCSAIAISAARSRFKGDPDLIQATKR